MTLVTPTPVTLVTPATPVTPVTQPSQINLWIHSSVKMLPTNVSTICGAKVTPLLKIPLKFATSFFKIATQTAHTPATPATLATLASPMSPATTAKKQ